MNPVLCSAFLRRLLSVLLPVFYCTVLMVLMTPSAYAVSGQELHGHTMGTTYHIKFFQDLEEQRNSAFLIKLRNDIDAVLDRICHQMSTYLPDSELSRFNRSRDTERWFSVSEATAEVAERAVRIGQESGGAFDVTLGPLVDLWGFGPSGRHNRIPGEKQLASLMQDTGFRHLQVRKTPPALLKKKASLYVDLSGIAKGYGVDKVAELLESKGIRNYLVEIGGEIRTAGKKGLNPWKIGIEHPDGRSGQMPSRIVFSENFAIATSGDYRNHYEIGGKHVSHILDPGTGQPLPYRQFSVTVIAASAMEADAWATAFFVMGPDKTKELAETSKMAVYCISQKGGQSHEWSSSGFLKFTASVAAR